MQGWPLSVPPRNDCHPIKGLCAAGLIGEVISRCAALIHLSSRCFSNHANNDSEARWRSSPWNPCPARSPR